jgi:hypothetical protein
VRPLEREELLALVRDVAAHPEAWKERLDPHATQRAYQQLHRDAHVDVWVIGWLAENDTGWRDDDTSSGAVHVISGTLVEAATPDRGR